VIYLKSEVMRRLFFSALVTIIFLSVYSSGQLNNTQAGELSIGHTGKSNSIFEENSYDTSELNMNSALSDDSSLNNTVPGKQSTGHTDKSNSLEAGSTEKTNDWSSGFQSSNSNGMNSNTGNSNTGNTNTGNTNTGNTNTDNTNTDSSPRNFPDNGKQSQFSGSSNIYGQQFSNQLVPPGSSGGSDGHQVLEGYDQQTTGQSIFGSANSGVCQLWIQGRDGVSYITGQVGTALHLTAYVPTGGTGDLVDIAVGARNTQITPYQFSPGYNSLSFRVGQADRHLLLFTLNNQPSNAIVVDAADSAPTEYTMPRATSAIFRSIPKPSQMPQHNPGGVNTMESSVDGDTGNYLNV
jgi:hypothetical protein